MTVLQIIVILQRLNWDIPIISLQVGFYVYSLIIKLQNKFIIGCSYYSQTSIGL